MNATWQGCNILFMINWVDKKGQIYKRGMHMNITRSITNMKNRIMTENPKKMIITNKITWITNMKKIIGNMNT
jgi:hypothetical protein